jgi:hypothetical protein
MKWVKELDSIVIPDTGIEIKTSLNAITPYTLLSPHRPPVSYSHIEFAKIDGQRFVQEINEILGA